MATNTKSLGASGNRKSTAAKSNASDAEGTSLQRATRARGAEKSRADSISVTMTPTEPSPAALSTPAVTERRRRTKPSEDSADSGAPATGSEARIVSVFKVGPFAELALVLMSVEAAQQIATASDNRGVVVEGVAKDLDAIREAAAPLADSALAGSAMTLALEMENPYNSATSKSMCANSLLATMNRLTELLPPKQETSALDDLRARREARRAVARESGT